MKKIITITTASLLTVCAFSAFSAGSALVKSTKFYCPQAQDLTPTGRSDSHVCGLMLGKQQLLSGATYTEVFCPDMRLIFTGAVEGVAGQIGCVYTDKTDGNKPIWFGTASQEPEYKPSNWETECDSGNNKDCPFVHV